MSPQPRAQKNKISSSQCGESCQEEENEGVELESFVKKHLLMGSPGPTWNIIGVLTTVTVYNLLEHKKEVMRSKAKTFDKAQSCTEAQLIEKVALVELMWP